ncbi:MAG TPA: hypothetical protein VNM72_09385 [Blastocatellia bacterium]|nr:hypothetical protein [Blastocatellia bacterium]
MKRVEVVSGMKLKGIGGRGREESHPAAKGLFIYLGGERSDLAGTRVAQRSGLT